MVDDVSFSNELGLLTADCRTWVLLRSPAETDVWSALAPAEPVIMFSGTLASWKVSRSAPMRNSYSGPGMPTAWLAARRCPPTVVPLVDPRS